MEGSALSESNGQITTATSVAITIDMKANLAEAEVESNGDDIISDIKNYLKKSLRY